MSVCSQGTAGGGSAHRTGAVRVAATTGIEVLAREDRGWLARPSLTDVWQVLLPCVAAPRPAGTLNPAGSGAAAPDSRAEPGQLGLVVR